MRNGLDVFATRVYVVGEVVVSLVVLVGGFLLVFYSPDQAVQLVGSGAVSAATVFWFQRRANEHSTNGLRELTQASLAELHEQQAAQRSSITALMQTVASRSSERAR
jgi:hypothetical protein